MKVEETFEEIKKLGEEIDKEISEASKILKLSGKVTKGQLLKAKKFYGATENELKDLGSKEDMCSALEIGVMRYSRWRVDLIIPLIVFAVTGESKIGRETIHKILFLLATLDEKEIEKDFVFQLIEEIRDHPCLEERDKGGEYEEAYNDFSKRVSIILDRYVPYPYFLDRKLNLISKKETK